MIYNSDCFDIFKKIPGGSIDMVLCDPPYGTTKAKWDSVLDLSLMWDELRRIVKPSGAILLFGSQPFTSILISSNFKDFRYEWIWNKRKSANFLQANKQPHKIHENVCVFYRKQPTYNPIKVPNPAGEEKLKKMMAKLIKERGYVVSKEEIYTEDNKGIRSVRTDDRKELTGVKDDYKSKPDYQMDLMLPSSIITEEELKRIANLEYGSGRDGSRKDRKENGLSVKKFFPKDFDYANSLPNSIIEIKKDNYGKNIFHPTQKPVELLRYLIKTYSNAGETVLDFTMGSGSTGVACKLEGREFIGIEKEKKYYDIATQRIKES